MEPNPEFPFHRVIKFLGAGANSKVFLGESLLDGSLRALKVYGRGPGAVHRFIAELKALTHVTHPHVVKLLDFGSTLGAGQDYLGLEYLDGRDFLSGTRDLSQDDFISLVVQVLAGLDIMHRKRFCHGDLTPAHLIVLPAARSSSARPTVKLIDLSSTHSPANRTATFNEGTIGYVAPEVIRGEKPSPASDLYSLGAILYECLSGNQPFFGPTAARVAQSQIQGDFRPLESTSLREIHPLIQRLLNTDPVMRPSSATEVIRAISEARPHRPVSVQVTDTSFALAGSCEIVGRDDLLKEASQLISQQAAAPHDAPPVTVLLLGEKGGGKTRFVTEVACNARSDGSHVVMIGGSCRRETRATLPPPPDSKPGQSVTPLQIFFLDDVFGAAFEDASRWWTFATNDPSRTIVFITVNTSTTPPSVLSTAIELLRERSLVFQLSLRPLTAEQIRSVATHSFPTHPLDAELVSFLDAQSGGNPLFIVELIRSLIPHLPHASARLTLSTLRDPQAWAADTKLLELARERIGQLSFEELKICRLLAVAEDRLSSMALTSLTEISASTVDSIVRALTLRGVLRSSAYGTQEIFSMAGMIVGTQVLASMADEEKHLLHESLAEFYLSAANQPGVLARAARHFVAAGRTQEGITYYATAARQAMKARDHVAACALLRTALSLPVPHHLIRAELSTLQAHSLAWPRHGSIQSPRPDCR